MSVFARSTMIVLICLPALAVAQTARDAGKSAKSAQPMPVVSTSPERTTASFGDWVLRCEGGGTLVKRICEVAQSINVQGQTAPIAQIAIGRLEPGSNRQLTLVLPTNVTLLVKPQVYAAKAGAQPLETSWQRCIPGGCFASGSFADSIFAGLGAETEPGRITFRDAADREVALPLSLRGLSQALDMLAKET